MEQLGDVGQMDAHFSLFGDNVSQVQDCCTVCTEHAIGSKIVFGASMELLGDMGQVEACFGLFEDSVYLGAR
jgi:hypothetical protein